jgi:hypothetical protein
MISILLPYWLKYFLIFVFIGGTEKQVELKTGSIRSAMILHCDYTFLTKSFGFQSNLDILYLRLSSRK